jgi:hypothetical protein
MPATSLFDTNTTLIGSRSLANCPAITDLSINSTIFPNTPLVFGISPLQDCSKNLFTRDPYLKNTNGCCVLDTSAQTCTGVAEIAEAEESSYYMGVRYYDANTAIGRAKGERKLCYTAPISRKKLEINDLVIKITTDVATLIALAIVASCYEYWFTFGECSLRHIVTNLGNLPYNVGDDNSLTSKTMEVTRINKCEEEITSSITENEVWYETFPYNLITYFNKRGVNDEDIDYDDEGKAKYRFEPQELGKILIRSFLLGFFYCIIFTRAFIKFILRKINYYSSRIYEGKPSKYMEVLSGLIFVFVFMGLWGNIYTKYVDNQPVLGGACLFLLMFLMMVLWFFAGLSYIFLLFTFMGYRRGTYTKYVLDNAKRDEPWYEIAYYRFDWHGLVNAIIEAKMGLTDEKDTSSIVNEDNKIIDEKILNWFYPIRRSDITFGFNLLSFASDAINKSKKLESEKPRKTEFFATIYAGFRWIGQCWYPWNWLFIRDVLGATQTRDEMNDEYDRLHFGSQVIRVILSLFLMFWIKISLQLSYIVGATVLCVFAHAIWITIVINFIFYFAMPTGLFGTIIAFFYLNLYVLIGFFYVPFKNYTSLLKIIKSHGNILTLLFCIVVIINSVKYLRDESAGVVGALLALIILYKIITTLSS